jgi:hypothetical protein
VLWRRRAAFSARLHSESAALSRPEDFGWYLWAARLAQHPRLSQRAKLVALRLAVYAGNGTGECWPSLLRLAEGIGRPTGTERERESAKTAVRRALRYLEAAGAVSTIEPARQHRPQVRRLHPEALDELVELPTSRDDAGVIPAGLRGDKRLARGDSSVAQGRRRRHPNSSGTHDSTGRAPPSGDEHRGGPARGIHDRGYQEGGREGGEREAGHHAVQPQTRRKPAEPAAQQEQ